MLLTDMGAEIVRIERPGGAALIAHRFDVTARSREMLELDLRPGHKKLENRGREPRGQTTIFLGGG
jgi:crotonobetainyl-CoA:carnitine CoA-transferase CaiB-like acyl-CoA transferase